jgi:hypothetical protein
MSMSNRRRAAVLWLALAGMLVDACAGGAALSSAPASDATIAPSPAPSTAPTAGSVASASASAAIPAELIGEWSSPHRCPHIVEILTATGYDTATVLENIVGNGLIPGVTSVDDIADPADPCAGSVDVPHSHSFSAEGQFASFDGQHGQVDDGIYQVVDTDTLRINGTSFTFDVDGDTLTLSPDLPADCATRDCGFEGQWATMVALPGQVWQRVQG